MSDNHDNNATEKVINDLKDTRVSVRLALRDLAVLIQNAPDSDERRTLMEQEDSLEAKLNTLNGMIVHTVSVSPEVRSQLAALTEQTKELKEEAAKLRNAAKAIEQVAKILSLVAGITSKLLPFVS